MLRVLIVAPYAQTRAGLDALLSEGGAQREERSREENKPFPSPSAYAVEEGSFSWSLGLGASLLPSFLCVVGAVGDSEEARQTLLRVRADVLVVEGDDEDGDVSRSIALAAQQHLGLVVVSDEAGLADLLAQSGLCAYGLLGRAGLLADTRPLPLHREERQGKTQEKEPFASPHACGAEEDSLSSLPGSSRRLWAVLQTVRAGLIVLDPQLTRTAQARLSQGAHRQPGLPHAATPAQQKAGAAVPALDPRETLTAREREVLQQMALGLANKQIAHRLHISLHTVKFHVAGILTKLGADSRTEAVTLGARRGLVTL